MEELLQSLVRNELRFRLVLEYAQGIGNNAKACRDFNIPDSSFYEWKKAYEEEGNADKSVTQGWSIGLGSFRPRDFDGVD